MIPPLRHPALDLPGIGHGWFTREGGVSEGPLASLNCGFDSGDAAARVAENRSRALAALDLAPDRLCTAYQTHSACVVLTEAPWAPGDAPEADALVTTRPGLALGVLTADCAPVLLADPAARVVAAAHAGWKGALEGIVEAAVGTMEQAGGARERTVAVIGPCIGPASYEVGPEFPEPFLARDPADADLFAAGPAGRFRFDLAGYVARRLARLGLARIETLGLDTCADAARFFSYRRASRAGEPGYGRLLSAIALRKTD